MQAGWTFSNLPNKALRKGGHRVLVDMRGGASVRHPAEFPGPGGPGRSGSVREPCGRYLLVGVRGTASVTGCLSPKSSCTRHWQQCRHRLPGSLPARATCGARIADGRARERASGEPTYGGHGPDTAPALAQKATGATHGQCPRAQMLSRVLLPVVTH